MIKGQSVIVEFILFFAIAFSLFSTISYFFYTQSTYFQERIGESTSELTNDLISSNIMKIVGCKACNSLTITEKIPSRIGGYYYKIESDNITLNTSLFSDKPIIKQTPVFNLNETFAFSGESRSENKKIEIKINIINKEVVIG